MRMKLPNVPTCLLRDFQKSRICPSYGVRFLNLVERVVAAAERERYTANGGMPSVFNMYRKRA